MVLKLKNFVSGSWKYASFLFWIITMIILREKKSTLS